jgi:hypothetical protein
MDDEDRQELVQFVFRTEQAISQAIEFLPEPNMRELAFTALRDVNERGEFENLRREIVSRDFDDNLESVGLSGSQLSFKLAVIQEREREVRDALQFPQPEQPPEDAIPDRPLRPRGRIRRAMARLLNAIDVVLDSLVGALHGAGEVIKELKQALENWLGD